MTPEVIAAWIAALQATRNDDIPTPVQLTLRAALVELLLAIVTPPADTAAARRRA